MITEEERKEYNRLRQSKHRMSETYKNNEKRRKQLAKEYRQTEEYKKLKPYRDKKWFNSEKGKEYLKSDKYKESRKKRIEKYRSSTKGKIKEKEYSLTYGRSIQGKIIRLKNEIKRKRLIKGAIRDDYSLWIKSIRQSYTFACSYCGNTYEIEKLTMDHVIPLSKGGSDTKDNLVPACRSCNSKKYNRSI